MANLFLGFPVSKAAFAAVAGSVATAFDVSKTLLYIFNFDTLDAVDVTVNGTGTITLDFDRVTLSSGAIAGGSALVGKSLHYPYGPTTWAKERKLKLRASVHVDADSSPDIKICTGYPTAVTRGFGFVFTATKIRGLVANNTGQVLVDLVTGLTAPYTTDNTFEAIFTPGVKVDFYIDGVLKGTITTKLPTGTNDSDQMLFMSVASTDAADHQIITSQMLVQQALT